MLEKFQMAISPQQLTIYLYSAHRAVMFAIAQLSCCVKVIAWNVVSEGLVRPQNITIRIHGLSSTRDYCDDPGGIEKTCKG